VLGVSVFSMGAGAVWPHSSGWPLAGECRAARRS
jgi:hypothetical protein